MKVIGKIVVPARPGCPGPGQILDRGARQPSPRTTPIGFNRWLSLSPRTRQVVGLALLLAVSRTAPAQDFFLQAQPECQAGHGVGRDSGINQSTNLVAITVTDENQPGHPYAMASMAVRAVYGQLEVTASAAAKSNVGEGSGAQFGSYYGGASAVLFGDNLTITSASLPSGTPVDVQVTATYAAALSDQFTYSGFLYQHLDTHLNLKAYSIDATRAMVDDLNTNLAAGDAVTTTLHATVGGSPVRLRAELFAFGNANANVGFETSVALSLTGTARIFVEVLTPGATYQSASGTVYSARPVLTLRLEGNTPVLSWPLAASGYTLQEQPAVDAAAWTDCPNPVTPVGQNFQVTLSPGDTNHFFRLIHR